MKDKTHDMNRGYSADEADAGFDTLNAKGEILSERGRKNRQLKWADLDGNQAMRDVENMASIPSEEKVPEGGFLPRNNMQDRY